MFRGGIVSYANEVKHAQLGVSEETLAEARRCLGRDRSGDGPRCARGRSSADVAVSVTGIAGPGGGTPEKPVGLVYLHASGPGAELARELNLPGDREAVRRRATAAALHLLRELLTQIRHSPA